MLLDSGLLFEKKRSGERGTARRMFPEAGGAAGTDQKCGRRCCYWIRGCCSERKKYECGERILSHQRQACANRPKMGSSMLLLDLGLLFEEKEKVGKGISQPSATQGLGSESVRGCVREWGPRRGEVLLQTICGCFAPVPTR